MSDTENLQSLNTEFVIKEKCEANKRIDAS